MSFMAEKRERAKAAVAKKETPDSAAMSFLGGGEMGERIRAFDWSKTPLGSVEGWSPALRMMVRLLLANPHPMLLWWGPQYVSIYNDSYRPILGTKHPWALSQPVSECWKEIWHILQPLIDTPFNGGPATWNEDLSLELYRHGFLEEAHFIISYSPVPDETAPSGIGGVLATVHEITDKVVGERRIVALRDLGACAGEAKTAEEACAVATKTLAAHDKDLPFVLLYLIDADGKRARLAGAAGAEIGSEISSPTVELDQSNRDPWPMAQALQTESVQVVEHLNERFVMPPGPWSDPPHTAIVVPIPSNKPHEPAALMVTGVSARLKLDTFYRDFFQLVRTQIATAIANARAYEEERKRAEALAELDLSRQRNEAQAALRESEERLHHSNAELTKRVAELQTANVEIQDSHRAALNVMEDALQSRQLVEKLNAELRNEITERKEAEKAKARLAAIVESSDDAIVSKDLNGIINSWNHGAERIFGYTAEEAIAQPVSMLIPPERLDEEPKILERIRRGERIEHYETVRRRKDGTLLDISLSVSPIVDASGQIVGASKIARDITERKQAEQALQKFAQELETRVAERTAELQQVNAMLLRDIEERKKLHEQLLQAQKMESVGTLAGGIAHDFNNILNIIQGYTFLLRAHGAQSKEISESLAVIDETVQRGAALVKQLLTLARKTEVKLESVDANRLIEGLIALIKQTFPKTIELNAELAPHLPLIMVDGNQLGQALLNLSVNARDAMPKGGSLVFRTTAVDGASLRQFGDASAERYVCMEVADTGVGMDERVQERIFEPFFTTKAIGQGTGLGLSVVYAIVKNHNGFINFETKSMAGTTFRLYLPADQSVGRPAAGPAGVVRSETSEQSNGRGTILVVEDEKNMLHLLEKALLKHGYQVILASDGQMALDIYKRRKDKIDAVLLDIGLPKQAGRDVLRNMKEENPNIKLVVTSGYLEPELKSYINQAGIHHFINKPYWPDDVIKTLQTLMEDKGST
jgi:PAS domain S-box-containing protein